LREIDVGPFRCGLWPEGPQIRVNDRLAKRPGNVEVIDRAPLVSNRRVPFAAHPGANAKLDPKLPCTKLVKAWRLWIPATRVRSPVGKGETAHD
jgi:hypothetical protein